MKYNTATDVVVVAPEILGSIQYMNNNNNNNNHIINNNNFNNNNNINNNNNVNDALNMKETNGMRIGVGVGGGNGVGVGCLSSFNNITNFLQEDLMFCNNNNNNNINNLNHNILDGQMFNNNNNNYSETSKRELASLLSLIKATAEDATSSAMKSNAITTTTNAANCEITPTPPLAPQSASSLASTSTATILTDNATSPMFCDQVSTVMSLFEKWNDCERTVIMFALLKRLRYASLKFLLYSINNHVQHYLDKHDGGATTSQLDINANNKVFLENLLNMYRRATPKTTTTTTTHINNNINNNNNNIDNSEITSKAAITKTTSLTSTKGLVEDFNFNVPPPPLVQHQTAATSISSSLSSSSSSSSSSASSTSSVSSTYGICVQPMSKDDILLKFLNLVPLLEPANIECKHIYMILLPIAIYDTLQQIVSTELVQQLLSYLLIHSAISGEDRKTLNVWMHYLEKHLKATNGQTPADTMSDSSNYFASILRNDKQQHNYLKTHSQPLLCHNIGGVGGTSGGGVGLCLNNNNNNNIINNNNNILNNNKMTSSESAIFDITQFSTPTSPSQQQQQQHQKSTLIPMPMAITKAPDWQIIAPPKKSQIMSTTRRNSSYVKQHQSMLSGGCLSLESSNQMNTNNNNNNNNNLKHNNNNHTNNLFDEQPFNCDKYKSISFEDVGIFASRQIAKQQQQQQQQQQLNMQIQLPAFPKSLHDDNNEATTTTFNISNLVMPNNGKISSGSTVAGIVNSIVDLNGDFDKCFITNHNQHADLDLNNSFSKNGNEILDYEPNNAHSSESNVVDGVNIGAGAAAVVDNVSDNKLFQSFPPMMMVENGGTKSYLFDNHLDPADMNRWSLDNTNKLAVLKTRRSNSLTTQAISFTSSLASTYATSASNASCAVTTVLDTNSNVYSTSAENLVYSKMNNKQRSYSLSLEHQRDLLTNSGSETRLDDLKKPKLYRYPAQNVGMSCVGVWLKSLRLHKYFDLFKNMTFDNMMTLTEEYLLNIGVTKGASHKLSLCIDKLKERPLILLQLENDLRSGGCKSIMQKKVRVALDELANMAMTPMKPIEDVNTPITGESNVAFEFLKILNLVVTIVQKDAPITKEEEHINLIIYIIERVMCNDAFFSQTTELKELKLRLHRLKTTILPKATYHANKNHLNHGNSKKSR